PGKDRLKVEVKAQTTRLLIEDGCVVGVEYRQGGVLKQARCGGEVVLSAGAVNSPQILQLSGVGPADVLREHGIEVAHEMAGVGSNLQDHLQLRCAWKLQGAKTLNTMANSLWGKAKIGMEYLAKRTGPMSMSPSQLGGFTKSRPDLATPDLEYHVQPLSLEAFGQPLHDFPAITASVCNLRPESRGHVRIRSADPFEAPQIAPNYLATEGDRAVAVAAIRQARQIMAQGPMAKYQPEEMKPGITAQDEAELARAAGDIGTTIFHPVGTVRMGSDAAAPLDGALRMRGLGGLRVVDASVMPTITSGNTNAPSIMIGEKAAQMMLAGPAG
ncbi:MAG: choline dehydrogenase, partial [Shimia sp.]|nr:choline dehydrogenase [Shimia sp.]